MRLLGFFGRAADRCVRRDARGLNAPGGSCRCGRERTSGHLAHLDAAMKAARALLHWPWRSAPLSVLLHFLFSSSAETVSSRYAQGGVCESHLHSIFSAEIMPTLSVDIVHFSRLQRDPPFRQQLFSVASVRYDTVNSGGSIRPSSAGP